MTLSQITGKESGILVYPDGTAIIDNWESDLADYGYDNKRVPHKRVRNCRALIKDYINYSSTPITDDDLRVPGIVYYLDGLTVIAPVDWA